MTKNIITLAVSCTLAAVSLVATTNGATASERTQFICGRGQNFPTTFVRNRSGKRPLIVWKFKWANNGVSREQRCQQVSARFQSAYNNGSLNFIANSRINGQRVICTAYRRGGACDVVLLTLRQSDDAIEILTGLKEALKGRGTQPLLHSSGERQIYYAIDIDKLIETIPVEVETSPVVASSNSNDVAYYWQQGFDYFNQGKNDLAIAKFNQAIELDSTNKIAYLGRGTVYLKQKQWNLAIADFDRAIESDSYFAVAYFGRGIARLQVESQESAISDLKTAAQLFREQNDSDGYQKVSEILKELGE